jgi:DNA-directed RNA polymerase subunit delta
MKRVIVDYKKINEEILFLLAKKYPYGYQNKDIIRFINAKNEEIESVQVITEDTIYLVKIDKNSTEVIKEYDLDDYEIDFDPAEDL